MTDIAQAYRTGTLSGWPGEEMAREAFSMVGGQSHFVQFSPKLVREAVGRKMFLYRAVRKALGQDTSNYPQQIGDCVSFGAKNAIEYLTCCEMVISGERQKFRPIFPPYLYGTGRVFVGNGQLGNEDGSLGAWMADAVIKYGVLAADEEGVPAYAGSVAKRWGVPPGPPTKFVNIAKQHPVKSAARITSWADLVAAIVNGYPCTVASNQGFAMAPDSRGFHRAQGNWGHQMQIMGVDDEYNTPYALILNSWGDVFGRLKAFDISNEDLPVGVIRAERSVVEGMIAAGETFAYSQFEGFPSQDLDEALFKIVGD